MSAPDDFNIDYVARLARIELGAEEKARYAAQLGDVIRYFEQLKAVDVSGVEPTAHAFDLFNVWQPDVPGAQLTPEQALGNVPAQRHQQVVVPKVIDEA